MRAWASGVSNAAPMVRASSSSCCKRLRCGRDLARRLAWPSANRGARGPAAGDLVSPGPDRVGDLGGRHRLVAHDLGHQTPVERLARGDHGVAQQELQRATLPDGAREQRGDRQVRREPDVRVARPDPRIRADDGVVGSQQQPKPAARRRPVRGRDHGHLRLKQRDQTPVDGAREPGQLGTIVGPTGAGKTTLVNLIMRFYDPNGGRITMDGVDVASVPRSAVRSEVGMVLQDTWLFGGTIRDNIAYGRLDATDEEIVAASKATFVDRFVHSLPDGYDTVIDEEGSNVSAGEKQLITIARAFLADPSLLILDEATSSVDTRTELLVQHAMSALRSGRTSFVIAHRLSTIRDADLILVMEDGAIVEQGTHAELLEAKGAYYRLYQSQFAAAIED